MAMKFSTIMISVIVCGLIVSLVLLTMTDIAANSEEPLNFDNDTLERYNKMTETIELSKSMRDNSSNIKTSNLLDLLGDLFQSGYFVARSGKDSFDTLDSMSKNAAEDMHLGNAGIYLFSALIGILSIIVAFILIGILINRDA